MSHSQKVEQGYLSFAGGLVTELNPLSTPDELKGTTSDELNMTVDTDGMVRVRRNGFELLSIPRQEVPGTVLVVRYWRLGSCYIVCSYDPVAVSDQYTCYTTFIDTADPSKDRQYSTKVLLSDFLDTPPIAFLRSKCIISYGGRPLLFYREVSGEFTIQYIDLFVRDFKLLNDSLTVTARPTTLTDEHKYNLYNAGWYQNRLLWSASVVADPVTDFFTIKSKYPSNADIAYLGDKADSAGDLKFDPNVFDNLNLGSAEAPRGHYVYNIRAIDRSAVLLNKNNDGAPSTTLATLLDSGNDPGTGSPPTGDIDNDYPEPPIPPGGQIP